LRPLPVPLPVPTPVDSGTALWQKEVLGITGTLTNNRDVHESSWRRGARAENPEMNVAVVVQGHGELLT
jgi:hypothetical protein